MCQSYRKVCACGQNTTEIFFGKMIFDEQVVAKTDLLAYVQAMKEWGLNREKRFVNEGWRKMRARAIH